MLGLRCAQTSFRCGVLSDLGMEGALAHEIYQTIKVLISSGSSGTRAELLYFSCSCLPWAGL